MKTGVDGHVASLAKETSGMRKKGVRTPGSCKGTHWRLKEKYISYTRMEERALRGFALNKATLHYTVKTTVSLWENSTVRRDYEGFYR